jgi:hypothetical protein
LGVTDPTKRAAAMMDAAMNATKAKYQWARSYLDSNGLTNMPVVMGEVGWMAKNPSSGWYGFLAHPANQKMYYQRLMTWAETKGGPAAVIYFEAFDEPWKQDDNGWGLFDVDRKARYAVQGKHVQDATFKYATVYTDADALYYKPAIANSAITQSKYTILADARTPATEFRADDLYPDLRWDAFGGTTVAGVIGPDTTNATDPGSSIALTLAPADYGWGFLFHSASDRTENMSSFAANGTLNFSIKTSYAGKLEFGISTDTEDRVGAEAFIAISNGQYGYCNTNQWCAVSIPLKDFLTANPKLDLRFVLSRFVIADRFNFTGNTQKSGLPKVTMDAIYWAK